MFANILLIVVTLDVLNGTDRSVMLEQFSNILAQLLRFGVSVVGRRIDVRLLQCVNMAMAFVAFDISNEEMSSVEIPIKPNMNANEDVFVVSNPVTLIVVRAELLNI